MLGLFLCVGARADIIISEICADNHCIYFDEAGKTPDWIELHNNGSDTVSLNGWQLADDSKKPAQPLDGLRMEPGSYLTVVLPKDAFGLSSEGECVYLQHDGINIAEITYPALARDVSWALIDGVYTATWLPTPGRANIPLHEGCAYAGMDGPRLNEILTSTPPYKDDPGHDYV